MSEKPRILFIGEGHGAQAVLEGMVEAGWKCEVYVQDAAIDALANQWKLPRAKDLTSWIDEESKHGKPTVLSAAYRPLILNSDLNRATIVNVHYALLPRYRGLHSTVWAILNGEKEVGFSVHLMDELLDAGPILYQERLPIGNMNSWELMLEMDRKAKQATPKVMEGFLSGAIQAIPQKDEDAIFVAKRNLKDCEIQWKEWNALYMERSLRALVPPYPRPYFQWKDLKWEIGRAEVIHKPYIEIPGHVVYRDRESVWIKLTDGLLRVWTLFQEGKEQKALDVFKMTGARLGSQ